MNSVVFGQNSRYYLNSAIESQQIGLSGTANFNATIVFGINFDQLFYVDAGFGYRWHFQPGNSEYSKLRWPTFNLRGSIDILKEKKITPGFEIATGIGFKPFDKNKTINEEYNPQHYYNDDPNNTTDYSITFKKMNFEVQSSAYLRVKMGQLHVKLFGGPLIRNITIYSSYYQENQNKYQTLLNLGLSIYYFI